MLPTFEARFEFFRRLSEAGGISDARQAAEEALFVRREDLAALINPIATAVAAREMVDLSYVLAGWHLMAKHQRRLQIDFARAQRQVEKLIEAAGRGLSGLMHRSLGATG